MRNKWNKVDNTNEDKIFDQSEENSQKWTYFEKLLQKLIFAIQVLCIFMTHGKPTKSLDKDYFLIYEL